MDPVVQEVLKTQYRLQLVKRIGRGGFGEVWEAATAEGLPCALKISLDPLDWGNPGIQRELENLQLIKNLVGHPHIVSLQDFWEIHGYLVTRWELAENSLEGILRQYREQGQEGIPLEILLQFMADAAQGIDFLNSRGIIHRDIKPSNLLVFFGRVKVGDLGLAKLVGMSTASHTGAGTLGYVPPEAYGSRPDEKGRVSPTVDLYGLAATYVKLRTGREPFGEHPAEIIERQKAGRPLVDTLTAAEKVVVLRALSPQPEDRPQDGVPVWVNTLREAVVYGHLPAGWALKHAKDQPESRPHAPAGFTITQTPRNLVPQILVHPWRKGDVRTLAEAIERVEPNGIIRLSKGTHYLQKPLHLTQPVRLIGQGMDRTKVVCDGPEYVLKYSGSGQFVASGITFKHTGKAPADVVVITNGEVLLESCRLSGGVVDSQRTQHGCGLVISGRSKGYVKHCQAVHNEGHGILVSEQAQPTLQGNTCQKNEGCGIAYFGFASGVARNNSCCGNKMYGIYVADQAKPTLEGNTCNGNKAEPVRGSSETKSAQAWTAVGWVLTIIAGLAWFIECQRRLALEEELRRLQRPGCVVLLLLFPILAFAGKIVAAELLYLLGIGG
jgi:parallel beta-helix repeat protein